MFREIDVEDSMEKPVHRSNNCSTWRTFCRFGSKYKYVYAL